MSHQTAQDALGDDFGRSLSQTSNYTPAALAREARHAVKGKGRYIGWELCLTAERGGCHLWAKYVGNDGVEGFVSVAI